MNYLAKFSPAESLLVLHGSEAPLNELLKVTFMDLLLKQVIRTFEIEREVPARENILLKYVEVGKKFFSYQPQKHELVFLMPFLKNNSLQIYFRHIVKMGYQISESEYKYQNLIIRNPNISDYFKKSFFHILFGGFQLNTKGFEIKKSVEAEIKYLEDTLPSLVISDDHKALDILKQIKGNVFLLPTIEFEMLKQIDREIITEMNKKEDSNSGCSGCTWGSFYDYSTEYSSSCGGDSGSGGGGCSGCGSSCGGCGGD